MNNYKIDIQDKQLILASNSPRRKEILEKNGFEFKVIPSLYEEVISGAYYIKSLVENCAYNKAYDVFLRLKNDNKEVKKQVIISADTVVVLDNVILGKPKDKQDAFLMLKKLSNRTHFVATSICLLDNDNIIKDTQITYVAFKDLDDKEIKDYISSKNPLDKAGSYGIQDENFSFAIKIAGEYENIVGFPIKLFKNMIK